MKHSMSCKVWTRSILGVIVGVVAVPGACDMKSFTEFSFVNTPKAEEHWTRTIDREESLSLTAAESQPALADEGRLPDLDGAIGWLNSVPLSRKSLRGKVVLVDIWTYSCINSLRQLPYMKSWAAKYKDAGLVVIGVHAPEFAFEKERTNVENAVRDLKLTYPVAIDSNHAIWQAFNNEFVKTAACEPGQDSHCRYDHVGTCPNQIFQLANLDST